MTFFHSIKIKKIMDILAFEPRSDGRDLLATKVNREIFTKKDLAMMCMHLYRLHK